MELKLKLRATSKPICYMLYNCTNPGPLFSEHHHALGSVMEPECLHGPNSRDSSWFITVLLLWLNEIAKATCVALLGFSMLYCLCTSCLLALCRKHSRWQQ